jgi:hypothetical protein
VDWNIVLPAILFHEKYALIVYDLDDLITTTTYELRWGKYNNVLIIDSQGQARLIKGARKVAAVGRFGGWIGLRNQRVKVELVFDGKPSYFSVGQFKERLLSSFEEWKGWRPRLGNFGKVSFADLRTGVEAAATIDEIFHLLRQFDEIPPESF